MEACSLLLSDLENDLCLISSQTGMLFTFTVMILLGLSHGGTLSLSDVDLYFFSLKICMHIHSAVVDDNDNDDDKQGVHCFGGRCCPKSRGTTTSSRLWWTRSSTSPQCPMTFWPVSFLHLSFDLKFVCGHPGPDICSTVLNGFY